MKNKMTRRDFVKGSALVGMAGLTAPSVLGHESVAQPHAVSVDPRCRFHYNKDGKFKILQLTDTHHNSVEPRSKRALVNVIEMVEKEQPDLVIHTGDVVCDPPVRESALEILQPIVDHKIPFIVTLGNHDGQYDKTRSEIMEIIRGIPYNINPPKIEGVAGDSNAVVTLSPYGSDKVDRVFYLFDTHDSTNLWEERDYDHIKMSQIRWYKEQSDAFTQLNGGKPIYSYAFMHIPIHEVMEATQDIKHNEIHGTLVEKVSCNPISCGLFLAMKDQGDVKVIVSGHDHFNDYIMDWRQMCFVYGRFSGGDMSSGNLKPSGARVFELTEGEEGFRSWIRLYGGRIVQDMIYPKEFTHYNS